MKLISWKSMLVASGLVVGGIALRALMLRRRTTLAHVSFDPADAAAAVATQGGIMDIDPEPVSQIAGEGIDLDAKTTRVHGLEEILEHAPTARLA